MMEARLHKETWWTTLTYSPDFEPQEYVDLNTGQIFEGRTLSPRHTELLVKRVRKDVFPQKFRYFLVGEYGDQNLRPHYHVCFFGLGEEVQASLRKCWTDPISKVPLGFVDNRHCGPITMQNARYTVGYTLKKLTKKNDHRLENRYPEFIRSSKGIGLEAAIRIAHSLNSPSGLAEISKLGDIPRAVRYDGKFWPLDRYMRDAVLKELGLYDQLKDLGREKFKKEMRRLSLRAELNPKFSPAQTITPFVMEQEYKAETAQKVLNTETRAKLKLKAREL